MTQIEFRRYKHRVLFRASGDDLKYRQVRTMLQVVLTLSIFIREAEENRRVEIERDLNSAKRQIEEIIRKDKSKKGEEEK